LDCGKNIERGGVAFLLGVLRILGVFLMVKRGGLCGECGASAATISGLKNTPRF
jgi:hypothetical protein